MDESKLAKMTWALKFYFRSSLPRRCPFRTNLSLQTNRKIYMQFFSRRECWRAQWTSLVCSCWAAYELPYPYPVAAPLPSTRVVVLNLIHPEDWSLNELDESDWWGSDSILFFCLQQVENENEKPCDRIGCKRKDYRAPNKSRLPF